MISNVYKPQVLVKTQEQDSKGFNSLACYIHGFKMASKFPMRLIMELIMEYHTQ